MLFISGKNFNEPIKLGFGFRAKKKRKINSTRNEKKYILGTKIFIFKHCHALYIIKINGLKQMIFFFNEGFFVNKIYKRNENNKTKGKSLYVMKKEKKRTWRKTGAGKCWISFDDISIDKKKRKLNLTH
jgi:hypothetical protein